jgi:hypothetical protein
MRTSVIRSILLGILNPRRGPIGLAALSILCIGLAQTGADVILEVPREQDKRTLHVMDYGYALPIEITAIRNLYRAHWLRDLEIELKNISNKPIYELYFTLFMPDDRGDAGNPVAVSLEYGRLDLIHPRQRPSADDKPIWPGETALVKVHDQLSRGYERHLRTGNIQPPTDSWPLLNMTKRRMVETQTAGSTVATPCSHRCAYGKTPITTAYRSLASFTRCHRLA